MTACRNKIIALSGGIGAGKSVVSKILRVMGYSVYDCDSEAKKIMSSDTELHELLCRHIHPQAVVGGHINNSIIAETVFDNPDSLRKLNSLVHAAVFADLELWRAEQGRLGHSPLFVESAITHSSGLIDIVDEEWRVEAPLRQRIERVANRSRLSEEQIVKRIEAQKSDEIIDPSKTHIIYNSDQDFLLPQIYKLLQENKP